MILFKKIFFKNVLIRTIIPNLV